MDERAQVSQTDYQTELDDLGLEWLRVRFTREGLEVTRFMVQYETTIDGQRVPVVRYDTAHGFPHRDLLNRRGDVIEKARLVSMPTFGLAMTFGIQDIQRNWRLYRQMFFGGEE